MVLLDPWGSVLLKDYEAIAKKFGLEDFDPTALPEPNRLMRRGVVFASRDFGRIRECIKQRKRYYALTGIMPTAERIHLGTKMVLENMAWFQEHGAKAYVLVADLEAAATRGISLAEARKWAMSFHIPAYIALGLDPRRTVFYFQSENKAVMNLAYEFAKKITLAEFRAIYGLATPATIMSALTQAADILYPQLQARIPGVIPVGIDQDPHIRLVRDIVTRTKTAYGFIPPSAIYNKFTPGLDGSLKMSKSKPESMLELPEPQASVRRKLMNALTGGRDTLEEQRRLGGQPESCMIFELYKQHFLEKEEELNNIYRQCKAGSLLCGEDKRHACEHMTRFLEGFEKRLSKARKVVSKLKFIRFGR